MIGVDCERPATSSTQPAIVVRSLTEQRLSLQLDELGLTDCLAPTDGEDRWPPCRSSLPTSSHVTGRSSRSRARPVCCAIKWGTACGNDSSARAITWPASGCVFSDTPLAKRREPEALERWAEAFDTYMLILDIAGTAAERGLLVLRGPYDPIALPFAAIFDHALPYLGSIPASACDGSTRKGGVRVMANKLTYVHSRVSAHSKRARFYSLD